MVIMGPASMSGTDILRGIITVRITDIPLTIIDHTALTIMVRIVIQDTGITIENGTIDVGMPGAIIEITGATEVTGATDMSVITTGVIGTIAAIAVITVAINKIDGPNSHEKAPGVLWLQELFLCCRTGGDAV
jgi:hypothetical protein